MTAPLLCGLSVAFLLLGAEHVHALLAWIVCAPLVIAARPDGGWRAAGALGAAAGVGMAACGDAPWVVAAGRQYFALSAWQAYAAVATLALACGGGFGAVLGVVVRSALRFRGVWPSAALAAGWVAWEWLLRSVLPYYPWVSLAATQTQSTVLLQVSSVAGQGGLSFAMAATGAALGLAVRRRAVPREVVRGALLAVGIIAATAGFGWFRLSAYARPEFSTCSVGAIDARIDSGGLPQEEILSRYAAETARAALTHPSVIVWPESALPGDPQIDTGLRRRLYEIVHQVGVPLIAGGPRVDWTTGWKQRLFNSAYEVETTGRLRVYDKRRLVPFAEYWPRAMGRRPRWLATDEVTPGKGPVVFGADRCRWGVLICFEADHPALAGELARAAVDGLVVLSNDAQLPRQAVWKEVRQAQLRAVETGRPVIRAANRGESVLIDPLGRIIQRQRDAVLSARLPLGVAALAPRLAALFTTFCVLATVGAVGSALRSRPFGG